MTDRRWTSSLAYALAGVVALVLVTAILSSALVSRRTSDTVASLSHQLADASAQRDQVRADLVASQQQSAAALANVAAQNRRLQHKLDVLVRFLRANGLPVPKIATEPKATPPPALTSPRPKPAGPRGPSASTTTAPQPTARPAPRPTTTPAPTTAPAITDLACLLGPLLCP